MNDNSNLSRLNEKSEINVRINILRGSKKIKIQRDLDINNYNHILYKEGKFKKEFISNIKNIRRLSSSLNDIIMPILVLNGISFYFCIILMISLCIQSKDNYSSNNINNNNSNSNSIQINQKVKDQYLVIVIIKVEEVEILEVLLLCFLYY